jgi:hypothetical protein
MMMAQPQYVQSSMSGSDDTKYLEKHRQLQLVLGSLINLRKGVETKLSNPKVTEESRAKMEQIKKKMDSFIAVISSPPDPAKYPLKVLDMVEQQVQQWLMSLSMANRGAPPTTDNSNATNSPVVQTQPQMLSKAAQPAPPMAHTTATPVQHMPTISMRGATAIHAMNNQPHAHNQALQGHPQSMVGGHTQPINLTQSIGHTQPSLGHNQQMIGSHNQSMGNHSQAYAQNTMNGHAAMMGHSQSISQSLGHPQTLGGHTQVISGQPSSHASVMGGHSQPLSSIAMGSQHPQPMGHAQSMAQSISVTNVPSIPTHNNMGSAMSMPQHMPSFSGNGHSLGSMPQQPIAATPVPNQAAQQIKNPLPSGNPAKFGSLAPKPNPPIVANPSQNRSNLISGLPQGLESKLPPALQQAKLPVQTTRPQDTTPKEKVLGAVKPEVKPKVETKAPITDPLQLFLEKVSRLQSGVGDIQEHVLDRLQCGPSTFNHNNIQTLEPNQEFQERVLKKMKLCA